MLLLAEYESGLVAQGEESYSLNELMVNLCELFTSVAEDREIVIKQSFNSAPISVIGDLKKMQRALSNLMDNAIKYSPKHTQIEVSLELTEGSSVIITIKDEGCGMAMEEQGRIFERFYRIERSRHTPGNGLGLNLAKAFIENQGGQLSFISVEGRGTSFFVEMACNRKIE